MVERERERELERERERERESPTPDTLNGLQFGREVLRS